MCEVIFVFYIIYFVVNELVKLYLMGWTYWKSYVLIADLAVIALVRELGCQEHR